MFLFGEVRPIKEKKILLLVTFWLVDILSLVIL
jgi:hypothetical protein